MRSVPPTDGAMSMADFDARSSPVAWTLSSSGPRVTRVVGTRGSSAGAAAAPLRPIRTAPTATSASTPRPPRRRAAGAWSWLHLDVDRPPVRVRASMISRRESALDRHLLARLAGRSPPGAPRNACPCADRRSGGLPTERRRRSGRAACRGSCRPRCERRRSCPDAEPRVGVGDRQLEVEVLRRRPARREIHSRQHGDVGDGRLVGTVRHGVDAHGGGLPGLELTAVGLVDVRGHVHGREVGQFQDLRAGPRAVAGPELLAPARCRCCSDSSAGC